jgi:autophagy-related protein 9
LQRNIETVDWNDIVTRLLTIRDQLPHLHPALVRLSAHDIAIRILRKENYLIALFNKNLLDLSVPTPILRNYSFLTKTMEWNLQYCVMRYIFDETNAVRQTFMQESNK